MRGYRMQVPVDPETRKAIEDYAEVMGVSPARACAVLLRQAAPGLVELTEAMKKASDSPARAIREMADAIHKANSEADQMAMDLTPKTTRRKKKAS